MPQTAEKACQHKQAYTKREAQTILGDMRQMQRRRGRNADRWKNEQYRRHLEIYKCPFCDGWHIGNGKKD